MKNIDQRLLILGSLIFFTLLLFVSEIYFKDDSQFFQVIANLVSGFGGAFLKDLMGSKPQGDASSTLITTIEATSTEPPKP